MTKKPAARYPKDAAGAFYELYGNGVRDFTFQGYYEAIKRLRFSDRTLARRVERILAPELKKRFFPRRQREWYHTSEATRARLTLLPRNPHVQADVRTVREVLHIPPGHIHVNIEHPRWKQVWDWVKPEGVRRVVEGNLASEWLYIHRKAARSQTIEEEDSKWLSTEMRESAMSSASVDLRAGELPEWLHHPLSEPESHEDIAAPITRTAGRLIERHTLPWHVLTTLIMFILTQDSSWIEGLEPLYIDITRDTDPLGDPGVFSISVKSIDEFTTKEDWNRVWINHVKPLQKLLWEKRGMSPQGRRTRDVARLNEALPFYQKMVETGRDFKGLYRSPEGSLDKATLEWDEETLRKTIHDLERLLKPKT